MVDSGRHRLCFKWWRIRPASHIPAAEIITLGVVSKLMFLDSSLVMESFKPGKSMGLIPRSTRALVSSS